MKSITKRIMITGANSYIGTSFEKYIRDCYPDNYIIEKIDMMDGSWRNKSFSGYDSIFHVAGIAHSDRGLISDKKAKLYYAVNTDLAIELAKKAKSDGVKQFVFMSSIVVYGNSAPIGKTKIITKDTPAKPANYYGDSKMKAEIGLTKLQDNEFRVVILRAPMVYGKGCKGNYPLLVKIATIFPVFPLVNNVRSMLYIDNLCEFVRLMIVNEEQGIFCPQNTEYSNTSELVQMIATAHGKKVHLIHGIEWLLKLLSYCADVLNKAFGSLAYDRALSFYRENYCRVDFEESIVMTESD